MTYVPNYMAPPPPVPGRGGLIAFGIVSIVIGSLAGCLALIMPLALLASAMAPRGTPGATPAMIIVMTGFYGAIAASFIWIGIGSCRCQRWVRPVILCLAWPWLITGLFSSVFMVPILSNMPSTTVSAGTPVPPAMPPQVHAIVMATTIGMLAIIYVALPLAYICFYQRRRVAEVLAECDLKPRWTDRCPTPVLGLSIWSAISGIGSLAMLQFMCLPFFGTYLTGGPAVVLIVVLSATMAFNAWLCYRLRPAGWWIALAGVILWAVSSSITFALRGIMEFYRHSQMSQEQLAMLEKQPFVQSSIAPIMIIIGAAVCVGYLLYVRRYFGTPQAQQIGPENN